MIKEIVFCDIDGTLKNSKGIITERNKQAISKLENINVAFVLCSGRTRQHVEKVALEVNASQYIISSNGSDVYDFKNKVEILKNTINPKLAIKLYNYCNQPNTRILIKCGANNYINKPFEAEVEAKIISTNAEIEKIAHDGILQINVMCNDLNTIKKCIAKTNKYDELAIPNKSKSLYDSVLKQSSGKEYYFDITNKTCSKGDGIQKLVDYLNLSLDKTISIGDSGNDITMFDKSQIDVAVGNSITDLKNVADVVTASNNESGVAAFLEYHYNLKN